SDFEPSKCSANTSEIRARMPIAWCITWTSQYSTRHQPPIASPGNSAPELCGLACRSLSRDHRGVQTACRPRWSQRFRDGATVSGDMAPGDGMRNNDDREPLLVHVVLSSPAEPPGL